MRRGLQIALTLLMTILIARPFDCLAGVLTPKAADCCAKGKCLPVTGADDCCKSATPAGNHLLVAKQTHGGIVPPPHLSSSLSPVYSAPLVGPPAVLAHLTASPPGSPPASRNSLPLLI